MQHLITRTEIRLYDEVLNLLESVAIAKIFKKLELSRQYLFLLDIYM